MKPTLLLLSLLLCSCVNKPAIITRTNPKTGTTTKIHTAGGHLFAREKNAIAYLRDGDIEMFHTAEDSDSAAGLKSYFTAEVSKIGVKEYFGNKNIIDKGAAATSLKGTADANIKATGDAAAKLKGTVDPNIEVAPASR